MRRPEGLDDFGILVLERMIRLSGPVDFDPAYKLTEWLRPYDGTEPILRDWEERVAAEPQRRGVLTQAA